MAELLPLPMARLVTRAFAELERQRSIFFDLPVRKFVRGDNRFDTWDSTAARDESLFLFVDALRAS